MKRANGSPRNFGRIFAYITAVIMVAVTLVFPVSAQAGNILHAGSIPAGQVVENDVFLTGESPVVEGTINGDVFIVGSNVNISGDVNGSVFVLARNLTLPGLVRGNLYAAAVEVTQPPDGKVERNLYALALSLITEPGSRIGRNLTTMAMSASLRGETDQVTLAIVGPWELFKILRDFFNRNIVGFTPGQPALAKDSPEDVSMRAGAPRRALIRESKAADSSATVDWLLAVFRSLLKFLIVGGLVLWAFPRQFQGWVAQVRKRPFASAGYGAVVLINGYLLPVLMLVAIFGLLLGLIYLSLPMLAWTFFWVLMGLSVAAFSLFLAASAFLSKAIVAFLLGTFILSRIAPGALRYRIVPLLLGLVIYVLLASIPYMGFFIGLVVTLLGLGAMWLSRKQVSYSPEAELVPIHEAVAV